MGRVLRQGVTAWLIVSMEGQSVRGGAGSEGRGCQSVRGRGWVMEQVTSSRDLKLGKS